MLGKRSTLSLRVSVIETLECEIFSQSNFSVVFYHTDIMALDFGGRNMDLSVRQQISQNIKYILVV